MSGLPNPVGTFHNTEVCRMQTQMGTQLSEMVVTKFDGAMDPVYIADHVVFTIISSAKNTIYADSH